MTHGLTSHRIVVARAAEVARLAKALVGKCAFTEVIEAAAVEVADEMLRLRAIRSFRTELMAPRENATIGDVENLLTHLEAVDRYTETQKYLLRQELEVPPESEVHKQQLLFEMFVKNRRRLRSLDEYERKAISRYLKLVRKLDYLMLEAQRKGVPYPSRAPR